MSSDLNIKNIERRRDGLETMQPQHSGELEIIHIFREEMFKPVKRQINFRIGFHLSC